MLSTADKGTPQDVRHKRTQQLLYRLLLITGACFLFGFALVPLYDIACVYVLGVRTNTEAPAMTKHDIAIDQNRWVTVQFDGMANDTLPWEFEPNVHQLRVHPGELVDTYFIAKNLSSQDFIGQAVPSVAPSEASLYFTKTECFCFTEQQLDGGQTKDLPLRFRVEPDLPSHIHTLTLSYIFYPKTT